MTDILMWQPLISLHTETSVKSSALFPMVVNDWKRDFLLPGNFDRIELIGRSRSHHWRSDQIDDETLRPTDLSHAPMTASHASGLPFLSPYEKKDGDFKQGVNFAVAGATALPTEVLAKMNIANPDTNSSLKVQLDWMSGYFNTCIKARDCSEKLKTSLFIVGEIGGDDYNYAFLEGKTIEEVISMVPEVVGAIITAVKASFPRSWIKLS
ncbi:hypothetical protein RHGRI_021431 [Rhododendron griersonianum]|uniref:Uncharacterized protein n=1 Tax=Rhododendron griersonianum TaxID=479676 RepID=A0AAV6JK75_9ERIC|nr:hypothetical protein RHGRI_021431 [Rhododendron griersonianum]